MNGGQAAHDRVVANLHMAGERSVVGENNFISNGAIMTDVAVGQKIPAATDASFTIAFCAPIYGHEFTKGVFIADFQIRRLADVFQVLRLLTDRAIGEKFVCLPGACRSDKGDVML